MKVLRTTPEPWDATITGQYFRGITLTIMIYPYFFTIFKFALHFRILSALSLSIQKHAFTSLYLKKCGHSPGDLLSICVTFNVIIMKTGEGT